MPKDADLVFCFGGTNDFGHGSAPLGKDGSKDVYTFKGAVNVLFKNLIKKRNLLTEYICLMKARNNYEICKLKEKFNLLANCFPTVVLPLYI